jgi:hypothetical protein
VVSPSAIALANPKEAGASDERDRLIALRGERVGGYVLAVGVLGGLPLAWVVAELVEGATKIVLYRRGT